MPPPRLEGLRQANAHIRAALLHMRADQRPCSAIRSQDISDLLSQLRLASQYSRPDRTPALTSPALEKELLEYRSNLVQLRDFLPEFQSRLLVEKARIEHAQIQLAAAADWAGAATKTL